MLFDRYGRTLQLRQKLEMPEQQVIYFDYILPSMHMNDTPFQNNFFRALNLDTEKQEVKVVDFTLFHNYL
jgi:hypothetical protein